MARALAAGELATRPLPKATAAPPNVSLAFGITGPCYTISSACASSGHAVIDAVGQVELLQQGLPLLRRGG